VPQSNRPKRRHRHGRNGRRLHEGAWQGRNDEKDHGKDPDFVQGSLYVDMRDIKTGIVLAPINPSIVGKDLTDVPDANGKKYRREIIELAQKQGKGWVDYQYKNPTSGKIEPKTTYILRVNDVVLEAGIYKK
jgi:signal transduction histidine kinase